MPDLGCLRAIPWETRNLGRQSFAVDEGQLPILTHDLLGASLDMVERRFGNVFVQVRVDKKNYHALPVLQRQGFYFVEAALVPYAVLKKNATLEKFIENQVGFIPTRFQPETLSLGLLNPKDGKQRKLVKGIAEESFSDDRFHLDPQCPEETANQRFSYWVDDLLADHSVVFDLLMYGGACIGFMARKADNLILAGFAKKYVGSGLGDFLWLSVLREQQSQGFKQSYTMISSNNTAILNLYARLGFKFKDPAVTLHYWS